MLKRTTILCLALLMLGVLCSHAQAAPKVMINYKTIHFETEPIIDNGTTLVPLRAIFEAMGAKVNWDESSQTVVAQKDQTIVNLSIGSDEALVNGIKVQLSLPARMVNGTTMVPLRFVSDALESRIEWDGIRQLISITTPPDAMPEKAKIPKKWEKFIGANGNYGASCVIQVSDGGYVITGGKDRNAYLGKLDLQGELLWERTYGGSEADYGASVKQTLDGGYIIAGSTNSFGAVWGDAYLVKTDQYGNQEWEKTFGRSGHDYANEVQQTVDGGFIVFGTLEPGGAGTTVTEQWMIKTDNDGNLEWEATFGHNGEYQGWSGLQTADGGYIIAGEYDGESLGNGLVVKTDRAGKQIWEKYFGGAGMDGISEIKPCLDGGYICVGTTGAGEGPGLAPYLQKIDPSGKLEWRTDCGGDGSYSFGNSVVQTKDGRFVAVASFFNMESTKFDKSILYGVDELGHIMWTKGIAGDLNVDMRSVTATVDGGLISVGSRYPSGRETSSIYVIKTDNKGNFN